MADENPAIPTPSNPDPTNLNPKKETVRISLPKKPAGGPGAIPPVKRETVRINIPKRDTNGLVPSATVPTQVPAVSAAPSVPAAGGLPVPPRPLPPKPAIPAAAAPALPVAPKPVLPAAPPAPPKPSLGVAPPRPTLGVTAPKPAAPVAAPMAKAPDYRDAEPVSMKPASPKKETARIQLPPEPKSMPKATVKMQQTKPLAATPTAQIATKSEAAVPFGAGVGAGASEGESGGLLTLLSGVGFAFSAIVFGLQLWTYLSK